MGQGKEGSSLPTNTREHPTLRLSPFEKTRAKAGGKELGTMWQKGGAGAVAGDMTKVKMVKGRMGRMINGKFFDHMGGLMGGVGMGMGMPAMPSMMLGGVMGMGTGGSSSIFGGTKSNFHNPLMPASSLLGDAGTQVPVDPYAGHGMMSNHVSRRRAA